MKRYALDRWQLFCSVPTSIGSFVTASHDSILVVDGLSRLHAVNKHRGQVFALHFHEVQAQSMRRNQQARKQSCTQAVVRTHHIPRRRANERSLAKGAFASLFLRRFPSSHILLRWSCNNYTRYVHLRDDSKTKREKRPVAAGTHAQQKRREDRTERCQACLMVALA